MDAHRRLSRWFKEATALEGADRSAFVERCRDEDAALAVELEELLASDTRGAGALDEGNAAALAAEVLASEDPAEGPPAPGERVGPYVVGETLGAGGFAFVVRARQTEPVERVVALKVLRPRMASGSVASRFASEVSAQARMNHEHVARVFDAGKTDDGLPFLAMELVEGEPITSWCDARGADLDERLGLFLQVCEGIGHAHQKGVIHRDLKPSNVLVTGERGRGSVRIIDFGIAKAIQGSLSGDSLRTLEGQLVGTPEYMSPEQAGLGTDDVDTRTDVYSLGVLLYELLVGSAPFELETRSLFEIQRTIHETEPTRPSARVRDAGERRGMPAGPALARRLRGDLDRIVAHAMAKDRAERYDTVAALATDVERFLRDEPILAAPPSAAYVARKFVRRHRVLVVAAAVVVVALVAGLAGTGTALFWAVEERDRADLAALDEAAAREEAERRADEVRIVSDFQQALFSGLDAAAMGQRIRERMLDEADEAAARAGIAPATRATRRNELEDLLLGTNFTDVALETLDRTYFVPAIESAAARFVGQPEVEARVLVSIGGSLRELGLMERAREVQERASELWTRAVGANHPETLWSRLDRAALDQTLGELDRAQAEVAELIAAARAVPERRDFLAECLIRQGSIADDRGEADVAEALRREAYGLFVELYGASPSATYRAAAALASSATDPAEAEALYRIAIEGARAQEGPLAATSLKFEENYASFLERTGRTREALEIRERTSRELRRVRGDDHPSTLRSQAGLGLMLWRAGRWSEAEQLLREAKEGLQRALGPASDDALDAAADHAILLEDTGRLEEAAEAYARVFEAQRRVLGLEHVDTLGTLTNLGQVLRTLGRPEEAVQRLELSVSVKRRVLGRTHRYTLIALEQLATTYADVGRDDDAKHTWAELIDAAVERAESPGATAEDIGYAAGLLELVPYAELGDLELALGLARKAVALERELGGGRLWMQLGRLASVHASRGEMLEALAAQREGMELAPEDVKELGRELLEWLEARVEAQAGRE